MRRVIVVLWILSVTLLHSAPVAAQVSTGTIEGTVTDPQGKPLQYAVVVVAGDTLGAMAGDNGWYAIRRVPPGVHRLRVAMLGFASVELDSVVVFAGRATRLDVRFNRRLWVPKPPATPREEWIRGRSR